MSLLAHATFAAKGFDAEKRNLDRVIQDEIAEAHRVQRQVRCSWSEALRIARNRPAK
jgi:hypothetical protein